MADVRAGRYRIPPYAGLKYDAHVDQMIALTKIVVGDSTTGPIVDGTALYYSLTETERTVDVYGDHPNIAPPWEFATICYRNEHGNVIAMVQGAYEAAQADAIHGPEWHSYLGNRWESVNPVDWDQVRWFVDTLLWIGGRGGRGPMQPTGPMHMWRFAVYDDGTPADLHWPQLCDYPAARWDTAHLVLPGVLNFMNCRNVELAEPVRPRPERKRIARTGLRISELNVFPVGKSRRAGAPSGQHGVPLTSVRGHPAHYGACCARHEPRGLLFGELTGRYWIPQHARGSVDHGIIEQHVTVHPDG